jgi:hypothetical protein
MATVTPGIQFVSGETVTPAKLNAAAAPTVAVADGEITTAKILDGNVTNAKLASGIDASKITTGTLPADRIGAGAVTNDKLSLTADAGEIKKALNADNDPPIYACRAWVNFAGRTTNGACDLDGSGNVASVSRTADGRYTLTFTTAMPDANYAVIGNGHNSAANNVAQHTITVAYPVLATGFSFTITDATSNIFVNPINNSIAIFR